MGGRERIGVRADRRERGGAILLIFQKEATHQSTWRVRTTKTQENTYLGWRAYNDTVICSTRGREKEKNWYKNDQQSKE